MRLVEELSLIEIRRRVARRKSRGYALVEDLVQRHHAVTPLHRECECRHAACGELVLERQHSKRHEERSRVHAPQEEAQPGETFREKSGLVHAARTRRKDRVAPRSAFRGQRRDDRGRLESRVDDWRRSASVRGAAELRPSDARETPHGPRGSSQRRPSRAAGRPRARRSACARRAERPAMRAQKLKPSSAKTA